MSIFKDNTVCLDKGDLSLCKNCDQERFQKWLDSQNKQPSASSVPVGNGDLTTKGNKPAIGKGRNPRKTVNVTDDIESDAEAVVQCTGCFWGIAEGEM